MLASNRQSKGVVPADSQATAAAAASVREPVVVARALPTCGNQVDHPFG